MIIVILISLTVLLGWIFFLLGVDARDRRKHEIEVLAQREKSDASTHVRWMEAQELQHRLSVPESDADIKRMIVETERDKARAATSRAELDLMKQREYRRS